MALTEIQGTDIEFSVRPFNNGAFKVMVCEETLTFDITNEVNTTKTKCGPFKGVSDPDFKANGSAVFNLTPTGSEVSYDDVVDWQNDVQKVDFIIRNVAITGYAAGAAVRLSGSGYFVSSQLQAPANDVGKFTWALEGVGVLNDTES